MKFAGDNHCHEQIKWLHFERNWNRNKGANKGAERDTTKYAAVSKKVLTPSEWIHKFHRTDIGRCDRAHIFAL